jgi:hypothetical protein
MGDWLMEWLDWMTDNPTTAIGAAAGVAVALIVFIVVARLAFAALGRRVLVGLGLRKRIERENPWATLEDRAAYGLRPAPRPWWAGRRRA